MKKSFFSMNAIIAVIILFSLSACEKENTNSASAIGKATITGTVKARLDLVTLLADSVKVVPSASQVKIYAKYSSKDLVTNPSTTLPYADIIKEVVLDQSGNYTFTVDANLKDVSVTLYGDDFRATLVDGTANGTIKVFTLAPITMTVTKDVIRIQDLVFRAK